MLKKLASLPILAFTLSAGPLPAIAQTQQPGAPAGYGWHGSPEPMMWGGGYGGPAWEMFPMFVVLVILVCVLIFYFARSSSGPHPWSPSPWGDPSYSALQILNERFAKGEIQKEEYEDKRAAILAGKR
jgi:putative membrane protein